MSPANEADVNARNQRWLCERILSKERLPCHFFLGRRDDWEQARRRYGRSTFGHTRACSNEFRHPDWDCTARSRTRTRKSQTKLGSPLITIQAEPGSCRGIAPSPEPREIEAKRLIEVDYPLSPLDQTRRRTAARAC